MPMNVRGIGKWCLVAMACLIASGCSGPSAWEQAFVPGSDSAMVAGPRDKASPVRLRGIPWDRMQGTLAELRADAGASNTHPDDWSAAQKLAAKDKLLRGLQFGVDADRVEIVGRSEFRTTETIIPDGSDRRGLEEFARKIGATDVVWASRVLGKTEKVVDRPVTSYGHGTFWGSYRDRDQWWSDGYSDSRTTWVPVRVPADETGFVAFFLLTR